MRWKEVFQCIGLQDELLEAILPVCVGVRSG